MEAAGRSEQSSVRGTSRVGIYVNLHFPTVFTDFRSIFRIFFISKFFVTVISSPLRCHIFCPLSYFGVVEN
jgi:hypothetical protein